MHAVQKLLLSEQYIAVIIGQPLPWRTSTASNCYCLCSRLEKGEEVTSLSEQFETVSSAHDELTCDHRQQTGLTKQGPQSLPVFPAVPLLS